jgi:protein-S-isoprenylcysteine O-methyltransferase Ste14
MMLAGLLLMVLLYFAVVGAILFGFAGRIDLPFFWLYVLGMAIPSIIATIAVYRASPDELKEQTRRGASKESQDKLTIPLFLIAFLSHWIIAGLDVGRYHWSDSVPRVLQIISLIGYCTGFALVAWSTIVNRFYSPSVRVQEDRGQQVITQGPYSLVRHPGYIGWLLFFAFSGMALGSWFAALPPLLPALAVIRRTIIEDRMLHQSLDGYTDYAQKVRYRLIPGVW